MANIINKIQKNFRQIRLNGHDPQIVDSKVDKYSFCQYARLEFALVIPDKVLAEFLINDPFWKQICSFDNGFECSINYLRYEKINDFYIFYLDNNESKRTYSFHILLLINIITRLPLQHIDCKTPYIGVKVSNKYVYEGTYFPDYEFIINLNKPQTFEMYIENFSRIRTLDLVYKMKYSSTENQEILDVATLIGDNSYNVIEYFLDWIDWDEIEDPYVKNFLTKLKGTFLYTKPTEIIRYVVTFLENGNYKYSEEVRF